MVAVALRGLAGRKFRASLTALAVVLGVAMISGTAAFLNTNGNGVETPSFSESLLPKIRALSGVDVAAGSVQSDQVRLLKKNGKVVNTGRAPPLGFSIDTRYNQFNPTVLTAGGWPRGPGQVVIDNHTASDNGYHVGDSIGIESNSPARPFRITGIAKFVGVSSTVGATFALFEPKAAQQLFHKVGQL